MPVYDYAETCAHTQQKSALESRHKMSRDARECGRIKAVLLRSEGWPVTAIAQALRKTEYSIVRHINDYLTKEKLKLENGDSESHLTDEQSDALVEHISEYTYTHGHQIVSYIFDRWTIRHTVSNLNKWLHQKGFTYKKPKGVPHKADTSNQAEFIEEYEELKASLPEDEAVFLWTLSILHRLPKSPPAGFQRG